MGYEWHNQSKVLPDRPTRAGATHRYLLQLVCDRYGGQYNNHIDVRI